MLFALALGVAVGTLIRKTLPAMAVTLAAYVGVRAIVALVVRRHYMSPKTISFGMFGPYPRSCLGDWVLGQATVNRAGTVIAHAFQLDYNYLAPRCRGLIPPRGMMPSQANLAACVHLLGLHAVSTYQPGSPFWAFQGIEFTIFVTLAVTLVVVAIWALKRRIAWRGRAHLSRLISASTASLAEPLMILGPTRGILRTGSGPN